MYSFSKTWTWCKRHKQQKVNLLRNALFFVILCISIIYDSLNKHMIIWFLYIFFNTFPLQWNVCSFSLMGLHWMSGEIKGEKQKGNTLIYSLKIFWKVLFKMSLFTLRSNTKTKQQKHAMPTVESSLGSFLKWGESSQPALTPRWQPRSSLPVAMDTSLSAFAFSSLGLFMTGWGVSYYGGYVCTAHCLPVIKARGCHDRDYSTADQRCWRKPKHALGKTAQNTS